MEVGQIFSELEEIKQEIFRRKVKNFQIAEHPSRFRGSGYEIHSINPWRLGEPMANVDWNLSLRTWPKKLYKTDRIETKNAPAILMADISPSVFVEVKETASRFKLLLHLVGALGFAANYFHDPVGVLAVAREIEFFLRPKLGRGQITYAVQLLLEKAKEFEALKRKDGPLPQKSGINSALEMLLSRLRRQCSIVLLSDFTDVVNGELKFDFNAMEALSSLHNRNVIAVFLDDPQEFLWKHGWGVVNVKNIETGRMDRVKAEQAWQIRRTFCEKREVLRLKFSGIGVDSIILSFGDHLFQLSQFLSERKTIGV